MIRQCTSSSRSDPSCPSVKNLHLCSLSNLLLRSQLNLSSIKTLKDRGEAWLLAHISSCSINIILLWIRISEIKADSGVCVWGFYFFVFVLFFEKKKSSEGDDSFTRRRVVLVICEAECYQKRRLPAQSTSFTKILVFNSRSRVRQISTTTSHRCLSRVMTLGMYVCAVPV